MSDLQRDKSINWHIVPNLSYAEDQYILKWWNSRLDELLMTQIENWQWLWYWDIAEEITKIAGSKILEEWRTTDPRCAQWAWYNILIHFAAARAEQLGYTKLIQEPQRKICLLCKNSFVEDSLPRSVIKILGMYNLDFCAPCAVNAIFSLGNDSLSENEILKYLQDLTSLLERVPTQGFGEGVPDLTGMNNVKRLALLQLLLSKPTINIVKSTFGSWLNALVKAGVLEDGARKTSRGIQSIAKDGHVCLSLGEKTIDDYLYTRGIFHEREPKYPEGNYRGDFKVGSVFIEYFGLTGNPEYDIKTIEKIRLCKKHNIALIAIYPQDLISQKKLDEKLSALNTNLQDCIMCPYCGQNTLLIDDGATCKFCGYSGEGEEAAYEYVKTILGATLRDGAKSEQIPIYRCPECWKESLVDFSQTRDSYDDIRFICFQCSAKMSWQNTSFCTSCGNPFVNETEDFLCKDCRPF